MSEGESPPTPSEQTDPPEQKQEQVTEQTTKTDAKKANPAFIAGAVLLAAAILFVIFNSGHRVLTYDKPIPYIFNKHFLGELREFASQQFHKEILVFHGAQGVGKTRGLRQFIEQQKEEGRIVFGFDFKMIGKFATARDLVDYLEDVVISGIQDLEGRQVRASDLRSSLALAEAMATVEGSLDDTVTVPIKDASLQRVARALVTVLERILLEPEVSIRGFLEVVDALAPLRPLIVVNDIESLRGCEKEEVREFGRVFWHVCENFANDYRILGVIVEISDESVLVGSFKNARLRTVEEFDPNEAQSILVKGSFFAKKNFLFIKDKFRGNGQKYAMVHDLLREGMTVNSAFTQIEKQTSDSIVVAAGIGKDRDRRLDFLRLLRSKTVLPWRNDAETAAHLLRAKVITLANSTHCRFPSPFVENTVEAVLRQYRK